MKLPVWRLFVRSKKVRITAFAVAGALLVASLAGLGYSFSAPGETGIPGVSYGHSGQFDYLVYLKPNTLYGSSIPQAESEEIPRVFFRDIIKEVRLAFSYKFDSSESASITNNVVVTITAQNPGMWQKEITILEESHEVKEFRVDFPLSLDSLDSMVDDIEEDIGVTSSERSFIIKATVHTTGKTATGKVVEDDFSHEITAILKTKTLELEGDFKGSDTGFGEGVSYKEEGWFDYEVYLNNNKLYGATVLRSEGLPTAEDSSTTQILGPGLVYFPKIIDTIKASFSYQFNCNKQISSRSEEVEITAIIENPGAWNKTLVLLPKTQEPADFTISFPVDIDYFNEVIGAIQGETGASGGSYNLKLKADVRTIAQTDVGAVNDLYTQTLGGKLASNTLTWDKELSRTQSGSLGEVTASSSGGGSSRDLPISGAVIALLALLYFGWCRTQPVPAPVAEISPGDVEAARARKKYKQVLVDIAELPEVKPGETVIPLSSLDDLVRISDDLVKPVLHQASGGRHVYCTIDGSVRYQYISQS
jgi:hypothetical protein